MAHSKISDLDDQLCFTVYSTNIAINRTYKPMLDKMGITYPQYLALCVLGAEGKTSVGAVAEALGLESSTITPLLKRLEQGRLVERHRNKSNERQVEVTLTEEGHALLSRAKCLNDALFESSGMSRRQIQALNEQIRSLRTALNSGLSASR